MTVSNARVEPEIELANQIAVGINKHKRHALVLKYTALTLIRQSTPSNLDCKRYRDNGYAKDYYTCTNTCTLIAHVKRRIATLQQMMICPRACIQLNVSQALIVPVISICFPRSGGLTN